MQRIKRFNLWHVVSISKVLMETNVRHTYLLFLCSYNKYDSMVNEVWRHTINLVISFSYEVVSTITIVPQNLHC